VVKEILELEARARVGEAEAVRRRNPYLYENQIREDEMEDLWESIQTKKKHWSKERKEQEYFKYFERKPMKWLKEHDKQEYQRLAKELEEHLEKEKQKKLER
jgi:hypothetical protein